MASIDFTYPKVLNVLGPTAKVKGRTESHAFLVWFLMHFMRLDDTDAQDAVCDGPDDKGVDGIYVDSNLEAVYVFQCRLVQNEKRTLGDTQLKEFIGTLSQFASLDDISAIQASTSNSELSNLLESEQIGTKVEEGYKVIGVFVTNIGRDANATAFLSDRDNVQLFDRQELERRYIPVGPTPPMGAPVTFDVFGYDFSEYKIGDVKVLFAPLKARELVKLDGIENSGLFAWNVRGSLGKTKVNRDIGKSIDDPSEHKHFLLFHNGLTVLCEELSHEDEKITIEKYSVVNGCQSLTSLYDHSAQLTDELRVMTRLIKLAPEHELADKITHHSNNQNPINARDLQSNSVVQQRLQNEINGDYAGSVFYRIKRGEPDQASEVIENDEAGRLLLAFDLKQPWACHQTYKILDELHAGIFARPGVNSHRVVAMVDLLGVITSASSDIKNQLIGTYRLTRYFLMYLLREALETDDQGRRLCRDPSVFLLVPNGRERLRRAIEPVLGDLVIDLNAELRDREEAGNPFDYKREFKSATSVRELSRVIIPQYQKAVQRDRAASFGEEWSGA